MSFEEAVGAFWDNPGNRELVYQFMRWTSLGMVVLGYLLMVYLLYLELSH